MSNSHLEWFGKRYIEASRDYRQTAKPRFIDKNNLNWIQIGLVLLASARGKDYRRPAQCARLLLGQFQDAVLRIGTRRPTTFAMSDNSIAIMSGCSTQCWLPAPDRILSVRYEDVVDDIESQTRRMLDFLGLEFEPQCIDFHLSTERASPPPAASRFGSRSTGRESALPNPTVQWLGPLVEELQGLAD